MNNTIKFLFLLLLSLFSKEILPQVEKGKVIQDNSFETFLADVQTADKEKESMVDDFISKVKQKGYPFFENDSNVVLLYKGDADSVYLIGDMTNWDYFQPMEYIKGTDLFSIKENLKPLQDSSTGSFSKKTESLLPIR